MRALSAPELLDVWEGAFGQAPVECALSLLAAACPELSRQSLAELTLGQRDSRLLTLREWTFGPALTSIVNCPQCGQTVELRFEVSSIRVNAELPAADEAPFTAAGYDLRVRPPNSLDAAAIEAESQVERKRRLLFERCVIAASRQGQAIPVGELPAETMDAAANRLAELDPQADVQLDTKCPACGKGWRAAFDIVSFFWKEIQAWACRTLHDVHLLARAYGWGEREILALTPARRQFYLEMVSA